MDVRKKDMAEREREIKEGEESKLTDSLIFNIIKKIEIKIAM